MMQSELKKPAVPHLLAAVAILLRDSTLNNTFQHDELIILYSISVDLEPIYCVAVMQHIYLIRLLCTGLY